MEVDATVDTGEAHSMFPASLLAGLRDRAGCQPAVQVCRRKRG